MDVKINIKLTEQEKTMMREILDEGLKAYKKKKDVEIKLMKKKSRENEEEIKKVIERHTKKDAWLPF